MKKLLAITLAAAIAAFAFVLPLQSQPYYQGANVTNATGTLAPNHGGTGVANTATKTITLGGPLVTSGAFTTTLTSTATTGVTLPTTGTLSTLAGSEAFTNKTYNGNSWTAGTGTLAIAAAKTFTASNTVTVAGTDGTTMTMPSVTGTVCASGNACTVSSVTFGDTVLSKYKQASYTGTLTGGTTGPTATINYTLIGNTVTMDVPAGFTATSNATTKTITGMPAEARPLTQKTFTCNIQDNTAARVVASCQIETTGVISIYATPSRGAFTASGTFTLDAVNLHYTTN